MVKLKPIWALLKCGLLVVLLLVIFAAVWLRQGAQSLNWAKPSMLATLNTADTPYVVNVGDMAIDWRDLSKLGMMRVQNVTLSGRGGAAFASLPEIYVTLDPLGFLPQRRLLNTIYVPQSKLFLTRDKEKRLRLGLAGGDSPMPPLALPEGQAQAKRKPWNGKLPFRHLKMDDLYLVISDEVTEKRLTSRGGSLDVGRSFGYYRGKLHLPFTYGEKEGRVDATIDSPERGLHVLEMALEEAPSDYLCILAACPGGLDFSGIVNVNAAVTLDDRMAPLGGEFGVSTDQLRIDAPARFPEPLKLSQSTLEAKAGDRMTDIQLTRLALAFEDTDITGSAQAMKKADGWYVNGNARADKLNIEKLYKYWPMNLAPDSRAWVTGSLKSGYGEDSTIRFQLTPADFANDTIADEAIEAYVNARDITVNYLSGFPEMHEVNGLVKFTGATITIDADRGTMLTGTTVSKVHILCPDLNNPATPMEITTTLSAPAADAATLLQLKHFTFDDALELNPATLKGNVSGTLALKFDAFSKDNPDAPPMPEGEISFDNVGYAVDLTLKDIAQPKFAGNLDIAAADGTLKADNQGMVFDGALRLGASNTLGVKATQQSGGDVVLAINGGIDRSQFQSLGLPDDRRFGEGTMKLLADVTVRKDDIAVNSGTIDLSDMAFRIPEIGWSKRRGAPATVAVSPKGKSYALDIQAAGLSAPGATLTFGPGMQVADLNIPRLRAGESDFGLRYQEKAEGFRVSLTGNTLDASQSYNGTDDTGAEHSLLRDFPAIDLTIDLGALILMPERPFTEVKGTLNCSRERCEAADIRARANNADIRATITQEGGERQFLMTSSDAGDFLRALDITDRMYQGQLTLKGTYDDSVTPPALPASLSIGKFKLRNSEILGRILSIGSLTGLANALTGSGIDFQKLEGQIRSQGGVIVITDGKAKSNALGITIAGTVDTNKSRLNLKGVLVPAAAINTLLGKIPLIGKLAGGDEGLIAFNFSVKGPYADPSVGVNPFSGLTPGFLRGIWGSNDPEPVEEGTETRPVPTRRHQRGVGQ